MSCIFAVNCHVDNGSYMMAVFVFDAKTLHQLGISGCDLHAVNLRDYTVSADFLNVGYTVSVNGLAVCFLKAFADWMGGRTLCISCIFQKLGIFHLAVMDSAYLEDTFCHGPGFIKYYDLCLGKCFQIVGTFYQDTLIAGAADSCEKAKRNTDDQCTWAADYQEGKGTVDPVAPLRGKSHEQHSAKRRDDCKGKGTVADCRGVIFCEFGNKVLGSGFLGTGIFHKIQNLGNGGFAEFFGGADFQHACHVDAAADYFFSGFGISWKALSGQGAGV